MIKTKIVTTYKDGKPYEEVVQELVSCSPANLTDNEIAYSFFLLGIAKFIVEYEKRLEDPSFYCDIEDMDIEKDEINTEHNIFPKQPEPLVVKSSSHLEYNYQYKPAISRRVYNTKYFRLIEKPYGY